ncbi:MAG: FHA domain-containing protein [Thermodesulfobacteriota bacterium]|nr:FHA domain-containing protein [Thermodesulfobacteriota bacterium]
MIKILLKLNQKVLKAFETDKDKITIGRLESNDIHIDSPAVSRQHAQIIQNQGNYLIEDLKSTNGTFLNKGRIATSYLKDGDVITIEKYALAVKIKTENNINIALSPEGEIQLLNVEKLK